VPSQSCPACGLIAEGSARQCDCGYDFSLKRAVAVPVKWQPARPGRIVSGVVLFFLVATSNARTGAGTEPEDLARALGALTAHLAFVGAGAWLFATGLPRSIAPGTQLKRKRRNLWLGFAGAGCGLMVVLVGAFLALSLVVPAVVTTWVYWFLWTWIAWLIADRRAVQELQRSGELAATALAGPRGAAQREDEADKVRDG